jgi:hypothetical protein
MNDPKCMSAAGYREELYGDMEWPSTTAVPLRRAPPPGVGNPAGRGGTQVPAPSQADGEIKEPPLSSDAVPH